MNLILPICLFESIQAKIKYIINVADILKKTKEEIYVLIIKL